MHLREQRKLESNWEKARVRVEMMLMYGTNNLFNREEMIHECYKQSGIDMYECQRDVEWKWYI